MRWLLLSKVSFWLIVIGAVALATPNPAWPEWLARMVLSTGVVEAPDILVRESACVDRELVQQHL